VLDLARQRCDLFPSFGVLGVELEHRAILLSCAIEVELRAQAPRLNDEEQLLRLEVRRIVAEHVHDVAFGAVEARALELGVSLRQERVHPRHRRRLGW
jgi:hypothetical protein